VPPRIDHLVGAGEQRRRHVEAERFRGRQVHDQIEFGRLLDREVARLCPAQNLVDIVGGPPEHVRKVWSIGHQTPRFDEVPRPVHRRKPLAQRRDVDSDPVGICEGVGAHIQRIRAAFECLEGGREILRSSDFQCDGFETERARRRLDLA
jgi:hypothetical protein